MDLFLLVDLQNLFAAHLVSNDSWWLIAIQGCKIYSPGMAAFFGLQRGVLLRTVEGGLTLLLKNGWFIITAGPGIPLLLPPPSKS